MIADPLRPPELVAGVPAWDESVGAWRVRFYGRGSGPRAEELPPARPRAWLEQIHGDGVLEARAGRCGRADALLLERSEVAAAIATADCVPVALVAGARAALVHAGWRGVVAGVVPRALERLGGGAPVVAYLGPAIGPCCYEVGEEVAAAVVAASAPEARIEGAGPRPHLALHRALEAQLAGAGVALGGRIGHCTRCRGEWLASYRREREEAGRNWALLWSEGVAAGTGSGLRG